MQVAGLPLHILVVHAAVVFTPLACLFAIVFAVVRRWRWATRWPTAVLTAVTVAAVWLSRVSGNALLAARPALAEIIGVHKARGDQLSWIVIGFAVVVLAGVLTLSGTTALASGRGAVESRWPGLEMPLAILLVAAALLTLAWVILAGDAGARAVWS